MVKTKCKGSSTPQEMSVHRTRWPSIATAVLVACSAAVLLAQQPRGQQDRPQGKRGPQSGVFYTDVPAHSFDLILARPTNRSVTASVLTYQDREGYLEYGTRPGAYAGKTAAVQFVKDQPSQILLESLQPDTRYYYRLRHRPVEVPEFDAGDEWTFQTQRSRNASFTFAVQADSHLDENANPELYKITLANAVAGKPDLFIDLGDTFMTDKRRDDFKLALPQYLAQRYYFGLVCRSAPLFLVLGNHDGEGGSRRIDSRNSMAAWSSEQRKRFFPNPRPDGFYTGNGTKDPVLGFLEDYYAWEWGNALFIVLDPYWPTSERGREDNWNWTLGAEQYRWLKKTLEGSKAELRFVFVHHPVGAKGQPIRGGIEAAMYNEWGGKNADGSEGFKEHRPGWDMPVHHLLVKNRVSVVFHGHDHMFAKEELDGIVYQLVPQPGNPRSGSPRSAQEYGYIHGDVLGGSGYLRVSVADNAATIDYVLSLLPGSETGSRKNRDVAFSYTVPIIRSIHK